MSTRIPPAAASLMSAVLCLIFSCSSWNSKKSFLSLTQMTTQERKLFWEQQGKIIHYTSLIEEAADGGMRVDTFKEIVACESDNSFKGCFAKEELWLDNQKWDEMRANVLALGLLFRSGGRRRPHCRSSRNLRSNSRLPAPITA